MAIKIKSPVRSGILEVSDLPKHLRGKENENWLVSFEIEAIRNDSKVVIVRVWRKVGGKPVESVMTLEEEETITFIDGDK